MLTEKNREIPDGTALEGIAYTAVNRKRRGAETGRK